MLEGNVSTTNVRTHVRRDVRTYVKRDVRKLEEPFLVPPPPHYVSNMFLWIIFPGRHRFPFPDTLCGCKRSNPWEYYYYLSSSPPPPSILYFLSYYYFNGFGFGGFGSTTLRTTYFQGSIGSFCFQFRNSQLTL